MKENLEAISIIRLKEMAKEEGLRKTSTLKKAELVELLRTHFAEKSQAVILTLKGQATLPSFFSQSAPKRVVPVTRPSVGFIRPV